MSSVRIRARPGRNNVGFNPHRVQLGPGPTCTGSNLHRGQSAPGPIWTGFDLDVANLDGANLDGGESGRGRIRTESVYGRWMQIHRPFSLRGGQWPMHALDRRPIVVGGLQPVVDSSLLSHHPRADLELPTRFA
jgi:hypothetical protein